MINKGSIRAWVTVRYPAVNRDPDSITQIPTDFENRIDGKFKRKFTISPLNSRVYLYGGIYEVVINPKDDESFFLVRLSSASNEPIFIIKKEDLRRLGNYERLLYHSHPSPIPMSGHEITRLAREIITYVQYKGIDDQCPYCGVDEDKPHLSECKIGQFLEAVK